MGLRQRQERSGGCFIQHCKEEAFEGALELDTEEICLWKGVRWGWEGTFQYGQEVVHRHTVMKSQAFGAVVTVPRTPPPPEKKKFAGLRAST